MDVIVLDNILPPRLENELYTSMVHQDTPWQYSGATYGDEKTTLRENEVEESQYVHVAFYEGDATYLWPLFHTPLYFLEKELGATITNIQRCKINCLSATPKFDANKNHPVHPDRKDNGWLSAIYYVSDGDGDTIFTDIEYPSTKDYNIVKRVTPKKGRFVVFPSKLYHASSPTSFDRRIAANYVFEFNGERSV